MDRIFNIMQAILFVFSFITYHSSLTILFCKFVTKV